MAPDGTKLPPAGAESTHRRSTPPELLSPFSAPWAASLEAYLNANERLSSVAGDWQWPIELIMRAEPRVGIHHGRAVKILISGGRCERVTARETSDPSTPPGKSAFVLEGSYSTWRRIMREDLHPVVAMMLGDIALEGSLPTIVRHTRLADLLVGCARQIPTNFPDEA